MTGTVTEKKDEPSKCWRFCPNRHPPGICGCRLGLPRETFDRDGRTFWLDYEMDKDRPTEVLLT